MYKGERFNSWTHLSGLLFALASAMFLIPRALVSGGDAWAVASCAVFAAAMVAVYASSTLYHSTRGPRKRLWEKIDHCTIYLLIAGTYTPLGLMPLRNDWGWALTGMVWALAALGLSRELWRPRAAVPALPLYICMGWLGVVATVPIIDNLSPPGLRWLVGGALLYTIGIAFYINDKRWPHAHGIWHLFVLGGSICHFLMVWGFLR